MYETVRMRHADIQELKEAMSEVRKEAMTAWYAPTPTRWVLCEITSDFLGKITVRTYYGEVVNGLKKRPITGAWICEK